MDITIHWSFLPHNDPEASMAFYRDTLGFEVRNEVGYSGMRWITVGPPEQPGTSIVLHPPAATPGLTDDERRTIAEMMAKGPARDRPRHQRSRRHLREAAGRCADVVQEPTDQPYGVRDCAFRDPAGNLLRFHERRYTRWQRRRPPPRARRRSRTRSARRPSAPPRRERVLGDILGRGTGRDEAAGQGTEGRPRAGRKANASCVRRSPR